MTTTTFKSRPLRTVGGRPVQIPFDFVPEFKPQELAVEFILVVNDEQTGKNSCPDCAGIGDLNGVPCPRCGGSGVIIEVLGDA